MNSPHKTNKLFFLEFIDFGEAVRRLENLKSGLQKELRRSNDFETLPAWGLYLALGAQIRTLEKLNCSLNMPVPWDGVIGFPSLPTMQADAKKYADFLDIGNTARIVLKSFTEWTLFCRETISCSCGGNVWKPRNIGYEILIRHLFEESGDVLSAKLFVAVRAGKNI